MRQLDGCWPPREAGQIFLTATYALYAAEEAGGRPGASHVIESASTQHTGDRLVLDPLGNVSNAFQPAEPTSVSQSWAWDVGGQDVAGVTENMGSDQMSCS